MSKHLQPLSVPTPDVRDRARKMLVALIGPDQISDTALRVATDWLKQEQRMARTPEQHDALLGEECDVMLAQEIDESDHIPDAGKKVETRSFLGVKVATPEALEQLDEPDECKCQAYPTHCANDCPLHGYEPPWDGVPQDVAKPASVPITDEKLTLAAAAIIDVMAGNKIDWQNPPEYFYESADWITAQAYAQAAFSTLTPDDRLLGEAYERAAKIAERQAENTAESSRQYPYASCDAQKFRARAHEASMIAQAIRALPSSPGECPSAAMLTAFIKERGMWEDFSSWLPDGPDNQDSPNE